jgi:hypothetical protein
MGGSLLPRRWATRDPRLFRRLDIHGLRPKGRPGRFNACSGKLPRFERKFQIRKFGINPAVVPDEKSRARGTTGIRLHKQKDVGRILEVRLSQ